MAGGIKLGQLAQSGAATGQFAKWDGSNWVPADAPSGGSVAVDIERQEEVATQTVTGTDTALTDTLDDTPKSNASVVLFLNGLKLQQGAGKDYTVSGQTITWLASTGTAPDLTTSDVLVACYAANGDQDVEQQETIASQVTSGDTTLTAKLSQLPKNPASVRLWLNGVLQNAGLGGDYMIEGRDIVWLSGSGTSRDLQTDDEITVVYVTGASADIEREHALSTEAITGTDTVMAASMDLVQPKNEASVWLFLNGVFQQQGHGKDYVLTGKAANQVYWLASSGTAIDMTASHKMVATFVEG